MRCLLISDCFYPIRKSISRHIYDLLKEFSSKKIIIDFYFPSDGKNKSYYKKNYNLKYINYNPININLKKKNFFLRGLSEFFFPYVVLKKIKYEIKVDKIFIFSPSIFFGLILKKLKKRLSSKVTLVLRDIFPDWVLQKKNYLWINPLYIFANYISKFQYKYSDVIATQSQWDKKFLKKKYKNKKIIVVYNWITPKKNIKNIKKKKFINFVFAGTIGIAQDWSNIIELIKDLHSNNYKFRFNFIGDGIRKDYLKNKLSKFKTKVKFTNSKDEKNFINYIKEMDVGLISLDYNIKNNNIPGKFFSYLEANIPILLDAKHDQEISKMIRNYKLGLTNVGSKNLLYINSIKFINNKTNHKKLKKNYDKILSEKFSTKIAAKQLLDN